MNPSQLLTDAFGRIREAVHGAVEGLDVDQLGWQPDPEANSIAWLVWHLTRIQDDHVAHVADVAQRWTADGWADRFNLPFDPAATGYGHTSADVAAVRVPGRQLLGYYDAVHAQTEAFLATVDGPDFDRVVDRRWDPPVTLGVRIVSVIGDNLAHAGQAEYVRGLLERR
ncbi:MAG TPA: DUF664 domain-containing protein [Acidimicrobiia bacterium]|nr:DUF664 domain-containing protein [Acidimicrobiia bacterium]